MWMVRQNSIIINQWLAHRYIGQPYCHDCVGTEESITRVLYDCRNAKYICLQRWASNVVNNFFDCDAQDWFENNLNLEMDENRSETWATMCHMLWYWQNQRTHNDDFVMPLNIVDEINKRVNFYRENLSLSKRFHLQQPTTKLVRWNPPIENWITLKNNSLVGRGGILQNYKGYWFRDYQLSHLFNIFTYLISLFTAITIPYSKFLQTLPFFFLQTYCISSKATMFPP